MIYDSTDDTKKHISQVRHFLAQVIQNLSSRSLHHDESKLEEPEKSMYDEYTPLLRNLTYGSEEYKECLASMGEALQHHYKVNQHHVEHFENGINGMSLLDLIEMVADWKAASMRHANGDMGQSLEINRERFGISEQLFEIIQNTVKELG